MFALKVSAFYIWSECCAFELHMLSRHYITLQIKIELTFDNKNGDGLSQWGLSENYYISLGSVSNKFYIVNPSPD